MNYSRLKDINKISIIGGPGTGKSTLANNIGRELNLPIYHIDAIHHLENWKVRDSEERVKYTIYFSLTKENNEWILDDYLKSKGTSLTFSCNSTPNVSDGQTVIEIVQDALANGEAVSIGLHPK